MVLCSQLTIANINRIRSLEDTVAQQRNTLEEQRLALEEQRITLHEVEEQNENLREASTSADEVAALREVLEEREREVLELHLKLSRSVERSEHTKDSFKSSPLDFTSGTARRDSTFLDRFGEAHPCPVSLVCVSQSLNRKSLAMLH